MQCMQWMAWMLTGKTQSQRGHCQQGTGPNVLFLAAVCISIQMVLRRQMFLVIPAVYACITRLHTHCSTAQVNTHEYTPCTRFQLFNYCHQSLFLLTPFIAAKGLFQQGSFQVLSHSFKCKWTSKSPQILNLHLFLSSEEFNLPSSIWLTTESNQIRAGTQRWFPDKCPCHFPLQTWDSSWKVLSWPSGLFIVRKQGCGDFQPASPGAQEST